jgi:hypothetical protein
MYSGTGAASTGSIVTSQGGRRLTFLPAHPFSAGETVFVTISRSVKSSVGAPLGHGFAWNFWVASRAGSGQYALSQTLIPGTTPYGGYGGDIDADGDLDLCVPNEDTSNVSVFLNAGTGVFGTATLQVGWHCSPAGRKTSTSTVTSTSPSPTSSTTTCRSCSGTATAFS